MERKHKPTVVKTHRFDPDLLREAEKIIHFTMWEGEKKYPTFTNFLVEAIRDLIAKERRALEQEGLVWEHITFKPEESKCQKK